ncbi:MAG: hypothetical protein V1872_01200 [bacterium]
MILDKINQEAPFVRKDNFQLLFKEIRDNSFDQNIKNWLKSDKIIALKRGFYIFSRYWDRCQDKDGYLNYLSSVLYYPSYISKETVLARYGMLTEAVYGISAVGLKTSRAFSSRITIFNYSKIKESLFTGFGEQYFLNNRYYIATKSKALFDYLYFYKRKIKRVNRHMVDELRINFEEMKKSDWEEFEGYLGISRSLKLEKIYKIIGAEYVF